MSNLESSAPVVAATRGRGEALKAAPISKRLASSMHRLGRRLTVFGALAVGDLVVALVADQIGRLAAEAVFPIAPAPIPAPITIVFFLCLGLYASWGLSPVERLRFRILGILTFAAVNMLMAIFSFSFGMIARVGCVAVLLLIFGHYAEYLIRTLLIRTRLWGVPAVLIGRDAGQNLASALLAQPEFGLRPVGFIDDGADISLMRQHISLPILGRLSDSDQLSQSIEVALVVTTDRLERRSEARLMRLPFSHVVLVRDPKGGSSMSGTPTQILGGMIGLDVRRDIYKHGNRFFKRAFDIALSAPLVVLATPIVLLLALAIKAIDPGPGFFRQRRVGQDGRMIEVLKLRTMYIDAEHRLQEHLATNAEARAEWERFFKLSKDPRVLPFIGNFIRRTSLDELPQLMNVLWGHMSLVGPRPFPTYHLNCFDEEFQSLRTSVPPGLTGFWQVSARSNGDLAVQKAQDTFYIQNWSVWLDLWILLETLPVVLTGRGAR